MRTSKKFIKFPQATQHLATLPQPNKSTACHQGSRKLLHIKHDAVDIHSGHKSVVYWAEFSNDIKGRPNLGWKPIDQLCRCTFCGPTIFTVSVRWFLRTSRPTPKTRNLVLFMLAWKSLLSTPVFHALSLNIHTSSVSTMSTNSSA